MTTTSHSTRRRLLIPAALALAAAGSLSACDGSTSHPPENDVDRGWTCTADADGVRSTGTITNHSSRTSFYIIEVQFRSSAGSVERSTSFDGVAPGATVTVGVAAEPLGGDDLTCTVSSVTRLKA